MAAAQAPDQRDGELDRDLGVLGHQPAHVAAEDRERVEVVDRLDGRRPALVVEHRELAEDVAGPERGERDLAPVGVLADRARVALADDVARVRRVALAEHRLAGPRSCAARRRRRRRPARPARAARTPGTCASSAAASSARAGIRAGIPQNGAAARRAACTAARARPVRRRRGRARGGGGARSAAPIAAAGATSASGSAIATAISATPAITSSTRSASRAASPGVQLPSSSVGARRAGAAVGDQRDRDGGERGAVVDAAHLAPAPARSRAETRRQARADRRGLLHGDRVGELLEQALALGLRVLAAGCARRRTAR